MSEQSNTAGTGTNASPEAASTLPVEPRSVAGNASEVDAALARQVEAYKGLQRRLNVVNEEALSKSQEADRLSEENATLKAQLEQLNSRLGEIEQVSNAKSTVERELGMTKAEAEMWRMVSTEFPALGPVVTNLGLSPKESPEATKAMLSALNATIQGVVQAETQRRVGQYAPETGSLARQEQLSEAALRRKIRETAGTPEYGKYADLLYAKIQAEGNYPKPVPQPYDDVLG